MHHDPLLSSKNKVIHHWGHLWVVLAVVLEVPHWHKRFALPVLCRLYRTEKTCQAEGRPFATKPALAHELIALVARPGRRAGSASWATTPIPIRSCSRRCPPTSTSSAAPR